MTYFVNCHVTVVWQNVLSEALSEEQQLSNQCLESSNLFSIKVLKHSQEYFTTRKQSKQYNRLTLMIK